MSNPLSLEYYSDILCVWAWISQKRLDELEANFGAQIETRFHFIDVFGDAPEEVLEPFEMAIHEDTWRTVVPHSSLNAHLVAKAVQNVAGADALAKTLRTLRSAFFEQAQDVSDFDSLISIVSQFEIDATAIREDIATGRAASALMRDYKQADDLKLRGSPSFVLDGGRQILFGNVGYRVLHANVEELLNAHDYASWC